MGNKPVRPTRHTECEHSGGNRTISWETKKVNGLEFKRQVTYKTCKKCGCNYAHTTTSWKKA